MESEMIESKQEADAGIQANGTIQFSTFYLKGQLLGVGVHRVQEVMKYQEMSRIPLARDYVAGLINLRGRSSLCWICAPGWGCLRERINGLR